MLKNLLNQIRETLDDAGSSAAAVADQVSATVDALVDAVDERVSAFDQRVEEAKPAVEAMIERAGAAGSRAVGSAVLLVALGGLLFTGWQHVNRVHRKRATGRSGALPEPLNRWEGEGGQNQMVAEAAPLAGQTGPDNSLRPEPSSTRPAPPGEF